MSTQLTINLQNQNSTQEFYFFQRPAIYSGGGQVYSNCLYSQTLQNFDAGGSVLTFQISLQYYAGIEQAHGTPRIGEPSGFSFATRPVDLAPLISTANDWTTASLNPLGLSTPAPPVAVRPGAFRITTPVYAEPEVYNVGLALEVNGGIMLSNFVVADPSSNTDCLPMLIYYVQTGSCMPGSVIDFTQSSVNAAMCDFTGGRSTINVTLNADGTWMTEIIL